TTIRTVGGVLDFDARVRDEIDAGRLVGPRIIASNMGVSVPGGHFAGSIATEAASPQMAVEHVDKIAQTKPNLIKLMVTGGVMDASEEGEPGVLRMPPEVVRAACDEAHRLGFKVAAHVESSEGVRVALEGGVDTIEHGAPLDAHAIALFKRRGAADVCTISPALPYAEFDLSESHAQPVAKRNGRIVMDGIVACARTCLAQGIPVGLGNDVSCPFVTHYNFWRELCYFHRYVGASNAQTLHLATLGNAAIAGVSDVTGSLEPGKSADLLVVGSNPLEDLSALRDVRMVALRGRLQRHPRVRRYADIDALLDRYM
ncbi:MAG: amidohydrolase family protein, partial [Parafannyhessea umbonata]|nr:amidohydrolase family protein [Parafannyhessea umbonata]